MKASRIQVRIIVRYHILQATINVEILAKKSSFETFYHSLYVYVSSVFLMLTQNYCP